MNAAQASVLITGANRGIGRAFVEAFVAHGARRVYAVARKRGDLDPIVKLDSQRVTPLVADVTNPEQVAALAAAAPDLNLLINNAGALSMSGALDGSVADLRRDLEVNYFGLLQVTRTLAPVIERNGGGVVANVLSVVSWVCMPGAMGYCASKAAAWSATQALRAALAPRRIRVVGVFPGPIDTDMAKEFAFQKTPPRDVAEAVIRGLAQGAEDICPDPMSAQLYESWKADHKAVERQFAAM